jgi:hypothetical protein
MSDLVERLRLCVEDPEKWFLYLCVSIPHRQAADRIEALEAALRGSSDVELRLLVDIVWQHATESTAVPFHNTADMLIAKYRAALAPEQKND